MEGLAHFNDISNLSFVYFCGYQRIILYIFARDASNKKKLNNFLSLAKYQRCPILLEIRGPPRPEIYICFYAIKIEYFTPETYIEKILWESIKLQPDRWQVIILVYIHTLVSSNIFKFETEYEHSGERCRLLMQNYVGVSFMWRTEYNGSSQWWNAIVTTKVRFTALFRHTFVNRTFCSE